MEVKIICYSKDGTIEEYFDDNCNVTSELEKCWMVECIPIIRYGDDDN